ncbi:receptor-like protein kinase 1 [Actinidia rufa]|uniref:Receptor-like protein kinase 1 n=1 Tax=Actinidia rufa TaxID=165716 RepID=A0A7J0HCK0_9ERIC|nr:receptor-like protein kinase 1 [Actinidia rufa]
MALKLPYLISFMLLLIFPFSATAQNYRSITLGSSLIANGNNSSWVSPSGDFAFGFQQIVSGGYLLAIWFDKIPEKTIVWSANGDRLAQEGSKIQLNRNGSFVLSDPNGQELWAPRLNKTGVTYASMLDTGNFVLASNNGSFTLWQSFDEPTDTLLPTQAQDSMLVMRKQTTREEGFTFILQSDGNLLLYTTYNSSYWSTMTKSGFQVIFNQSGSIYLTMSNGTELFPIFSNPISGSQFYLRVILEYDGVLRQYMYPKSANSAGGRPMEWSVLSFLPPNICTSMRIDKGRGVCGYNSYCVLGSDQRPTCKCPSGYTFFDPNDDTSGCRPTFVPQNCDEELHENDLFIFIEMSNTDWPYSEHEYYHPVTEDWCREVCLNDCFCAVAIFRNQECRVKHNPFFNGQINPGDGGKALIKIRKDNSTTKSENSGPKKKDQNHFDHHWISFVRDDRRRKTLPPFSVMPGINLISFTYKELEEATDGFKEELGRGAFSTVYKGVLNYDDSKAVAVKRLDRMVSEGETEFKAEVSSIGKTNHKNLAQLIGKNFELNGNCENDVILVDCDCYKDGKLELLVENDDEALGDMKRVEKFVMIAIWCIQEDPSLRPTMKKVTQMLEGAVAVSVPPDPSSFISSIYIFFDTGVSRSITSKHVQVSES